MKKYNIIYADPAWKFGSKQLQVYDGERFKPLEDEYRTSEAVEFNKLPIKDITEDDCALFLWTTDAHMEEALELIKAWGFKYKTVAFIWKKVSKKGKQLSTLGSWTMKNCEICLFATKGAMLKHKKANNIQQLIEAERTKHSKKPNVFADKIVELFGDLPRIELFARDKKEGWDAWGDEIESDIKL